MTDEKTHKLNIGGESFDIKHNNKRLYKFMDWKSSRESLLRIILECLKDSHNIDTAYINISMANPMRRSRLGNFYIAIEATVSAKNVVLGTLEELGLNNILVDDYITYDEDEIVLREDVEIRYSTEQYNKEASIRVKALEHIISESPDKFDIAKNSSEENEELVTRMLNLEGWSKVKDNRLPARIKRLPSCIDLSN